MRLKVHILLTLIFTFLTASLAYPQDLYRVVDGDTIIN